MQWPKEKGQNLQNTTQKTKDRATRTPLNTWDELRFSGKVAVPAPTSDIRRVTLATHPLIIKNEERIGL